MANHLFSRFSRALGLFLVFTFGAAPLIAQLDPRLQSTSTDFLDLYQQSSNAKLRPEIVTLFDYSGSMEALMFHPAYRNTDITDAGYYNKTYMSFTLTPAFGGTLGPNTYRIKATARQAGATTVNAMVNVTVGGTTAVVAGLSTITQVKGSGSAKRSLKTTISNITVTQTTPPGPSGTITPGVAYTFSATITEAAFGLDGTTAVALSQFTAAGGTLDGGLNWTLVTSPLPTTLSPTTTNAAPTTTLTTWTSAAQTTQWTAPALNYTSPPAVAYVSASIGMGTCTQLIKPDGTPVTVSDAHGAASYATSNLYGAPDGTTIVNGEDDVRNWVRAASHARFVYSDNGVQRTLDIPIPWKVLDENSGTPSVTNPLKSATVKDTKFTKTNLDGTTTSWGSDLDIEFDKGWRVTHGSEMLSGGSAQTTTTSLSHIAYHNVYVSWLFKGKYTDGTYSGKYIVYDAMNHAIVGGQLLDSWGRGFGSALLNADGSASIQTITVPSYGEALNAYPRPYQGEVTLPAAKYRIPSRNRVQAVKEAAIRTWVKYQNDVYWAFRFIGSNADTLDQSTTAGARTTEPDDTAATYGTDRAWYLLNGNSLAGMNRIAYFFENTNTPLTYSTARTLAQFTDPSSVFNGIEIGANKPSTCQSHFLLIFTDGRDNVGTMSSASPYLDKTTLTGSALIGNKSLLSPGGLTNLTTGSASNYWNVYTYAGIAAHLADPSVKETTVVPPAAPVDTFWFKDSPGTASPAVYPTTGQTYANMIPYSILERGAGTNKVDFRSKPHRVTTMTVGVSLGGSYIEPDSPKYILFASSATGDPTLTSWDLNNLKPFAAEPDPQDPTRKVKKAGTTYFFDGYDPASLMESLDVAVQQTLLPSNVNAAANPNLPFIGSAFGKQLYLAKFRPPSNGGAVWGGDLLMFATKEVNSQIKLVDASNNELTVVDYTTARWSASGALSSRLWSARTLYTRIPNGSALQGFTYTGTGFTDTTTGLKNFVATSFTGTDADTRRQAVIQYASGGDTATVTAPTAPAVNRNDIMGDIINSSPTPLEYNFSDVSSTLSSYPRLSGVSGNRFRLILVGTNQGWLHAFGEVTKVTTLLAPDPNAGQEVVTGQADELWAFMPTDFLANLNYITQSGNSHRFMVDGTPSIYFLDLPPTAGGTGNSVLDKNTDPLKRERAIAIIGLRKGGRSYYALDVYDPFNPTLKWSLVPDEASSIPSLRNLTGLDDATLHGIVANMGFSTSTPALGRVMFKGVMKDVVFLGGGLSTPETDHNFPTFPSPPAAQSTPLGRSVIALDVNTGDILAAVDLSDPAKYPSSAVGARIGPIASGIVPFEFFLNSGMAQRAYFMDYNGGLWSWGSKAVSTTAPFVDFRMDNSDLAKWTTDGVVHTNGLSAGIRKVYQDSNLSTDLGALYTALPAPFLVSSFPGAGKSGSSNPVAVGIAMVSGDRNNPLDRNYISTGTNINRPVRHRMSVVFDRQDSRAWGLDASTLPDTGAVDSNLQSLSKTAVSTTPADKCADAAWKLITPGCPDYYLAPYTGTTTRVYGTPKFGYYVNFADGAIPTSQKDFFIPKGINSPFVNAGHLFYSIFSPSTGDLCAGGSGYSETWYISDVLNPIVTDTRGVSDNPSGLLGTWTGGVASDFFGLGSRGVVQGGATNITVPANSPPSTSRTKIELKTFLGDASSRFPKLRVWRTVH